MRGHEAGLKYPVLSHDIGYRKEIDGLRSIAVVAVVLFHAGISTFSGGFIGVDIFFVISGFLITKILVKEISTGDFSILKFYERRIRRLFPALFTVIIVTTLAGSLILLPDEFSGLGRQILATCLFLSNVLFWTEKGYFDADSSTKPLLHTWSLSVEEQYYIIFPIFLWISFRYFRSKIHWIFACAILISLILCEILLRSSPSTAFYMLPPRAWELMIGGFVAIIPPYIGRFREIISWAGIAGILIAVFTYNEATPFPGLSALPPCTGTAIFLWCSRNSSSATILSSSVPRFLGLISYSLYLWHWPIIVFLNFLYGTPLPFWIAISAILGSTLAAFLSWRYVERPFRKRFDTQTIWVFGSLCLVLGIGMSALLIGKRGLQNRFTPEQNRVVEQSIRDGNAMEAAYSCVSDHIFEAAKNWGVCRIGAKGAPRIIIVGDSQAMALKPAFSAVFEEAGIAGQLISTPGCTPLLGLDRVDDPGTCTAASKVVVDYVRRSKPDAVVLIAAWRGALTTKNTIFDGQRSSDDVSRLRNVTGALARTMAAYHSLPVRVGIVEPLPGAPVSTARAMARGSFAPLAYSSAAYRQAFASLNRAIKGARPDAIAHPAELLCKARCAIFDLHGNPLYWDQVHPSAAGNATLKPLLGRFISELHASRSAMR